MTPFGRLRPRFPYGICLWLLALALLPACSTDVDVNAPYQTRAVVYGLLSSTDSVHYIRVQKSFQNLQEPDAFKAAKVKDSIYFPAGEEVTVTLVREESNGQLTTLGAMERLEVTGKDTGIFHAPDHIIYRYRGYLLPEIFPDRPRDSTLLRQRLKSSPSVLANRRIRLVVSNRNGYQAIARTKLVYPLFDDEISQISDNYRLITPTRFGPTRLFATQRSSVQFYRMLNGAVFKIIVTIPYEEVLPDNTRDTLQVNWPFMSEYFPGQGETQIGQQLTDAGRRYEFFEILRENVDTTRDVSYRRLLPVRIRIIGADSALASYMQISGSYSAITQTRPFFSNVTGGLGLLASRTEKTFQARTDSSLNGEVMRTFNNISRYRSLKFRP